MPQNAFSVRKLALWTAVGLSLLLTASCRHSRCAQQCSSTTTPGYYTCASPGGGGTVYSPPMIMEEVVEESEFTPVEPSTPTVPPAPVEPNTASQELYYPNTAKKEAQTDTPRRNPVQAIKDGLKPLGTKFGQWLKRKSAEKQDPLADETEALSSDRIPSSVSTPRSDLGNPGFGHSSPFLEEEQSQPDQSLPADDLDQFGTPQEEPLFGVPEGDDSALLEFENDEQLPIGSANSRLQHQPLALPVSDRERKRDLKIYQNDLPVAPPAPTFNPEANRPQQNSGPELEAQEERFDAGTPQMLRAPVSRQIHSGAKQAKFVPVPQEQFTAFQIPQLAICSEVRSFQDYDEIDRGALQRGREILIYNTLQNIVSERSPQGYRTLTRATVELLGHGDRVVHRSALGEAPDASRSERRDYFITHQYVVPKTVPQGMYTLRLRVEDVLGHQAAHSTMSVRVVD